MLGILGDIIESTRRTVANAKSHRSLADVTAAAKAAPPVRGFVAALTNPARPFAIIAEIKRKSPSAGLIRPEYAADSFAPESIARRYHAAGAAAISCLTDEPYFAGHLSFLPRVRQACPLPILRKDFIVDPYQLYEARAAGADAILLIAECLDDADLLNLHGVARSLALDVLLEVHDADQLTRCVSLFGQTWPVGTLLGVNNRDLRTMTVDLANAERAATAFGRPELMVAESGIKTFSDLARLKAHNIRIALVGEHLMREPDPGFALSTLLGSYSVGSHAPGVHS